MKNYNTHLTELRKNKGLSVKEAAKQIGIRPTILFCYENGYFRPNKKNLAKINAFYDCELSLEGDDGYPAPNEEHKITKNKESLRDKRIIFGSLLFFSLLFVTAGAIMFANSVTNTGSHYGEVYQKTRDKVIEKGDYGYDIVTSMKYYYVSEDSLENTANIVFYQSNNILYFNEANYTVTTGRGSTWDLKRFNYNFGFNLGVDSSLCQFTYGSVVTGEHFSCNFIFDGKPVTKIKNFKLLVAGDGDISEEMAIEIINSQIDKVNPGLSALISNNTGEKVDFYSDFLPAREQGRIINFVLQIAGLIFLFIGIICFFILLNIFVKLMTKNIKPRLVSTDQEVEENIPLPKDWNIPFGIPDVFVVMFGKILQYGSIFLFLLALLAKVGVPFLFFLSNPVFLTVFRWSWVSGIFLEYFVMIGRLKKPTDLIRQIVYYLTFFLFIATIETVLISITNAWGYDLAGVIYKYVPGNVYQVIAINYLIFLFLFFQPPFLNKKKKSIRILWHSLSLIPLAGLVLTYIFSNRYALVYGVEQNIYINFWFPNAFLLLSIVGVLFIYITFFLRLYYENKYGSHNAQYFFYGHKYSFIQNVICASLILIVTSIDFAFVNNQYAHYLGLGGNFWMYFLIPFILLCKYTPNSQQIFIIDSQFTRLVEDSSVTVS